MNATYIGTSPVALEDPAGHMRREFAWYGPGSVARVDALLLNCEGDRPRVRGDVVTLGSLRLRIVDTEGWYFWLVMRDGWRARVYAALYPLQRAALHTYYRLILTAGIWGMAHTPHGTIPSWRDVYALTWLTTCLARYRRGR